MQYAGNDAVDGEFLGVTEAHVGHGLVGQLKVADVVKLNVTQTAPSQELTHTHTDNTCSYQLYKKAARSRVRSMNVWLIHGMISDIVHSWRLILGLLLVLRNPLCVTCQTIYILCIFNPGQLKVYPVPGCLVITVHQGQSIKYLIGCPWLCIYCALCIMSCHSACLV